TLAGGERHLNTCCPLCNACASAEIGSNFARVLRPTDADIELGALVDRERLLDDIAIDARRRIEVDGRALQRTLDLSLNDNHPRRDGAKNAARLADRNAFAVHVAFDVSGDEERSLGLEDKLLA